METHPTDDTIEDYALGRLSENESAQFEEHILMCPQCQDALRLKDAFLADLRSALKRFVQ